MLRLTAAQVKSKRPSEFDAAAHNYGAVVEHDENGQRSVSYGGCRHIALCAAQVVTPKMAGAQ